MKDEVIKYERGDNAYVHVVKDNEKKLDREEEWVSNS